jgi:hypothetical protein
MPGCAAILTEHDSLNPAMCGQALGNRKQLLARNVPSSPPSLPDTKAGR